VTAIGRGLAAAAGVLLVVGCGPLPRPSPVSVAASPETCPEAALSTLPPGFVADPPFLAGQSPPFGIRRTYRDPAGHELSILSGIDAGEVGGTDTGQRLSVRGHEAAIRATPSGDSFVASWLEGPPGAPCSAYAVIGTGVDLATFLQVLAGVR
jgi:hypothetical protein